MSLTWTPERQQTSLRYGKRWASIVQSACGVFCPVRRECPLATSHLFSSVDAGLNPSDRQTIAPVVVQLSVQSLRPIMQGQL